MARILIVEDDENITKMIEAALSIVGHTYVSCADAGTAVDMILYGSYDLVLLDIMLPGADGFSVMEQVRHKETPVIFLTALQDVSDKVGWERRTTSSSPLRPSSCWRASRWSCGALIRAKAC